jgi:PhnB protein
VKNKVDYKPEGFHSVNPYLTVKGAAQLLDFLKQAFAAEEIGRYLEPSGRIAHACVKIGDSMVEMSDSTEQWPPTPCSLHFYVPNVDAVYQRAVKAGGTSLREPEDQFYGERSAGIRDMCGNNWFIGTRIEILTKKEIDKRSAKMAGKHN